MDPVRRHPREVPVCAADEARLKAGHAPDARTVDTPQGPRPYWEAGPAYGPWAAGYYTGEHPAGPPRRHDARLHAVHPAYAAEYGGAGFQGGDFSGADYNPPTSAATSEAAATGAAEASEAAAATSGAGSSRTPDRTAGALAARTARPLGSRTTRPATDPPCDRTGSVTPEGLGSARTRRFAR